MKNPFHFMKSALCAVLTVVLLCAWSPGRRLLETSYPLPPDITSYHQIRVQVGEISKVTGLSSAGAYRVESRGRILAQGPVLKWTTIEARPSGIRFGNKIFKANAIIVRSVRGPGIRFNQRLYRNNLEIKRTAAGKLLVINHIELEQYLKGVLPFEGNPKWTDSTLRASAIVSRTFALFKMIEKRGADYDVGSGVLSQVYAGENVRHDRTDWAVDQTRGQVLLFKGEIFPAYFHSTSGGATTAANFVWPVQPHPALQGVLCEYCNASVHDTWSSFVSYTEIEKAMNVKGGRPIRGVYSVRLFNYDRSGRAAEIELIGKSDRLSTHFSELRGWVSGDKIKSTLIVRYENDPVRRGVMFYGRGWGHGVGLDQYGAKRMGELGRSAGQILDYFFPGSYVEKIYE